jgi:hypothetical protein
MLCFGSADSTGFTGAFYVSADSKGDSGEEAPAEKSMSEHGPEGLPLQKQERG